MSLARREILAGMFSATSGSASAQRADGGSPVTEFGRNLLAAMDAVSAFAKLGVFETLGVAQKAIIPTGTTTIKTRWYAEPMDFGGATWRRAFKQSAGPGRRQFADGIWWELAEINPTPEQFGAPKDQNLDCTAAIQESINFIRENAASVVGKASGFGQGNQSYLRLRPRKYICGELDYTTDGTLIGLGIRGSGPLLSTLVGNMVSGPWPILDCSGISSADLRDFGVTCSASSLATCGILLARDINSVFHNFEPHITDVWVSMNPDAPNLVSSIVVQSADLATLTRVFGDRSMGFRTPPMVMGKAQGGAANSITLDSADSAADGAYAGYPIRITSGPGAQLGGRPVPGQRNTIISYNATTKVATVKFPWNISTPTSSSFYEISAVKSKFRDIGAEPWPTRYVNIGGQAYGKRGFIATGAGSYGFTGTYIACSFGGDENKCAFHLVSADPNEAHPGQMNIDFSNTNFENQAGVVGGSAVLNQYPSVPVMIRHSGELEFPQGHIFSSNGGGMFSSFEFGGSYTAEPNTKVFNLYQTESISLRGVYSARSPGHIGGGCKINSSDFDWNVRYWDSQWLSFFNANLAGPAFTTAGMIIPRAPVQVPSPVSPMPIAGGGGASAQITLSLSLPTTSISRSSGSHTPLGLVLRAGVFSPANGVYPIFHSRVTFGTNGPGQIGMHLRQRATETSIAFVENLKFRQGDAITFDLTIQNTGSGFGRSTLMVFVGTALVFHGANFSPAKFDVTKDASLEFDSNGEVFLGAIENRLG